MFNLTNSIVRNMNQLSFSTATLNMTKNCFIHCNSFFCSVHPILFENNLVINPDNGIIDIYSTANAEVHYNSFIGTKNNIVRLDVGGKGTLDASNNYWGTT